MIVYKSDRKGRHLALAINTKGATWNMFAEVME